jgi:hypothetical protein
LAILQRFWAAAARRNSSRAPHGRRRRSRSNQLSLHAVKAFHQCLIDAGKPKLVAIVAVAHDPLEGERKRERDG